MTVGQRLRYYLYCALIYPLAILPLWALYILSDCLYFLFYKVLKYRIKVVRKNLETSFPDKSEAELRVIERRFYHNLCDNIVETIKQPMLSDKQIYDRIRITNPEVVEAVAGKGTPIMLYLAHFGNWEWMLAVTMHYPRSITSCHVYKPMHDKAADKLMYNVRGRFPSRGIATTNAVREILTIAREHPAMMVGLISDHRINSVERKQSTEFLNHVTPFYVGGEQIGRKVNAAYYYLDVEQTGRGRYRLTYVPIEPEDDGKPFPVTRKYYQLLETTINRNPGLWLWSHRRWLDHELIKEPKTEKP